MYLETNYRPDHGQYVSSKEGRFRDSVAKAMASMPPTAEVAHLRNKAALDNAPIDDAVTRMLNPSAYPNYSKHKTSTVHSVNTDFTPERGSEKFSTIIVSENIHELKSTVQNFAENQSTKKQSYCPVGMNLPIVHTLTGDLYTAGDGQPGRTVDTCAILSTITREVCSKYRELIKSTIIINSAAVLPGEDTDGAGAEEEALAEAARARVGVTTVHTVVGDEATAPATLSAGLRDGGCRGGPAWARDDGVAAPRLLSVVVSDPDANDFVYSAGDTVTLTFDAPTDRGGAVAAGGNKAYVDRLVSFSDVLAYDYSGTWNEGTTVFAGRTDVRPPVDYSAPPTYLAAGGALLWRPAATVFTITILQASPNPNPTLFLPLPLPLPLTHPLPHNTKPSPNRPAGNLPGVHTHAGSRLCQAAQRHRDQDEIALVDPRLRSVAAARRRLRQASRPDGRQLCGR